jgi:DNA-binding CsgD family transcriptional regulator
LRAAADHALRLHALSDPDGTEHRSALAHADRLAALVDREVTDPTAGSEPAAWKALCRAERARAGGTDTTELWDAVARAWTALDRPYPAAYARWREAEAAVAGDDLHRAAGALRAAHGPARRLAADPLLAEIEAAARIARVDLANRPDPAPAPPPVPAPRNPFKLTPRELEVLPHLAAGATNGEIARALGIADRTAGVHVSNILSKFKVDSRTKAAALAHRLRLLVDP